MRIEPRNPPPPVNFKEWDSLTRIAFSRKNKTLGACFKADSVLTVLDKNFRVQCAAEKVELPEDFSIKDKVAGVLSEGAFADKRARTMDIDGFLLLLSKFNEAGIHLA